MPTPERFVSPDESFAARLRGQRFAIASAATVVGTIVCALIVASLMRPQTPATQATALNAAETTRAAERVTPPAASTAAIADCREQTSPYVAQPCRVSEASNKQRVRVISTDKPADPVEKPPAMASQPTVEAQAPQSKPASTEPAHVASIEPAAQQPVSQISQAANESTEAVPQPPTRNIRRAHSPRRGSGPASEMYYRRHTAQF